MQKLWDFLEPFVYNRIYQVALILAGIASFLRAYLDPETLPVISILSGIGLLGLALFVEKGIRKRKAEQDQSTE